MTSPPLPGRPGGNRTLRNALLAAVAVVVIAGLVAIVVLIPGRNSSPSAVKQPTPMPSIATPPTDVSPSPTASPSATPSVSTSPAAATSLGGLVVPSTDPQAARKTAIASAFVQYNEVVNNMETAKTQNFGPLYDVAADPLYTAIEEEILQLYSAGHLTSGRSAITHLVVTAVEAGDQTATLTACEDQTHVSVVDAKTGVIVEQADTKARIVDAATLRVRGGRWKVTGLTHPSNCS